MNEGMKRPDRGVSEDVRQEVAAETTLFAQLQALHRHELDAAGTLLRAAELTPIPTDRLNFGEAAIYTLFEPLGDGTDCERITLAVPHYEPLSVPCLVSIVTLHGDDHIPFPGFTTTDIKLALQLRNELLSAKDEGLLPHLDTSLSQITDPQN